MDILAIVTADANLTALRASGRWADIAAHINKMGLKKVVTTHGGVGAVMQALGPVDGAALLDQLDAMATANPAVRWAFTLINRGDLDFGSPATRAMIDSVCPPAAAVALKAIAEVPDTTDHLAVAAALGA